MIKFEYRRLSETRYMLALEIDRNCRWY